MSPKHLSSLTLSMTFGNIFLKILLITHYEFLRFSYYITIKLPIHYISLNYHGPPFYSGLTKGIQCSSCLLNVNSRWVHNTPVFRACDILFHQHQYLQTSFESREAWTCPLVNRCPLANLNRSYRSCSRNCCPRTCYSNRMHIYREQSWLHPSTSSSRHHVIPTSRTCDHWKGALNDSIRIW